MKNKYDNDSEQNNTPYDNYNQNSKSFPLMPEGKTDLDLIF